MKLKQISYSILFLFAVQSNAYSNSVSDYFRDGMLRLLHRTSSHGRHVISRRDAKISLNRTAHAKLTLKNCGQATDPIYVDNMEIIPNPVIIPGPLTVAFNFTVSEDLEAPIPAELEMSKKISLLFGLSTWFTIPCLDYQIGSCDFDDLCEVSLFKEGVCTVDKGVERCGCPFKKGYYMSKPVRFDIPEIPDDIPSYLLEGEFFVQVNLKKNSKDVACYSTSIDLDF